MEILSGCPIGADILAAVATIGAVSTKDKFAIENIQQAWLAIGDRRLPQFTIGVPDSESCPPMAAKITHFNFDPGHHNC